MSGIHMFDDRNQEATVWVGGLDPEVDEALLWELMLQAGPVVSCHMPKDRVSAAHQGFAFVEFRTEADADYAIKILNMVKLFSKPIRVNKAARDRRENDVGANLFVGNLDEDVEDQLLYTTFSAFGQVLDARVMTDETGKSRGFGFISFASFDAADASISAMNGQFLCNRTIQVSYAYKKEGEPGERHGSAAERLLAKSSASEDQQASQPHIFASAAPGQEAPAPPMMPSASTPAPGVGGGMLAAGRGTPGIGGFAPTAGAGGFAAAFGNFPPPPQPPAFPMPPPQPPVFGRLPGAPFGNFPPPPPPPPPGGFGRVAPPPTFPFGAMPPPPPPPSSFVPFGAMPPPPPPPPPQ